MIGKIRDTIIGLWPVLKGNIPKSGTIVVGVIAFLIGLLWAYALQPTVFYDADPSTLQQSWQDEWVRLVADRYAAVQGSSVPSPEFEEQIVRLLRAVDNPLGIVRAINRPELEPLATRAQENSAAAPAPGLISNLLPFIVGPIIFALAFVVGSLLWGFYISTLIVDPIRKRLRPKSAEDQKVRAELDAIHAARDMQKKLKEEATAAPVASDFGPPVARHVSIYFPGRAYDDSFSIEDEAKDDEFLGECGAVISETIGVGGGEKVTAIEVWLFDKEDFVRTLTGVFVSEHAYNDPALRSKLEPKGQLVVAKPGAIITLETNALRMQARMVDIGYGSGEMPANSFFDKSTIELQAWRKTGMGAPVAAATPSPVAMSVAAPSTPPAYPSARVPTAQPAALPPYTPPPAVQSGGQPRPLNPPPLQYPPPAAAPKNDDDPFGGTGDFTPISS
jgi:hypothetical protein